MRFAWRWFKRIIVTVIILLLALLAPVGYNGIACRGDLTNAPYSAIIAPAEHRAESATYLTYPEWHIVFAYDDYAKILETQDPHDFGYFKAISGFWEAVCTLTETADNHGGAPETKNMVYVIGVSFTAELLAKAAYEETIGRVATWLRGSTHSDSDKASAKMARNYAEFLHQIPWYKYDFPADIQTLNAIGPQSLRDRERQFSLGLEFAAKTAYAKQIANLVDAVGQAKLSIRSVIKNIDANTLRQLGKVTVIAATPQGVEIETPRYAEFTGILQGIADQNGTVVEIAGNDEIMVTVTGAQMPEIITDFPILATLPRQGYNDTRWLVNVRLADLTTLIRALKGSDATLEHIFDY